MSPLFPPILQTVLGLRRHTVQLDAYDPDWKEFGREECARIDRACEDLRIRVEHVGSTSVPGLAAKPILDMVLGLPDPEPLAQVRSRLVDLGYIDRGKGERGIGHLLVREPEPDVRTVHVHAVLYGSTYWKQYVFFRDALRQDPEPRPWFDISSLISTFGEKGACFSYAL